MLNITPIDDVESTDKTEDYIQDLENEISELTAEVNRLRKKLATTSNNHKDVSSHSSPSPCDCAEKYEKLLNSYHKLLDDILPF